MVTDHQFSHLFHQDQVQQQMDRKDEEVKTMREAHQGTTKDFVCCWWNDNQTISIWNLDPKCLIWIRRPIYWPIIWYWPQNVTSCFTCGQHWKVFHSKLFHVFSRCGTWFYSFYFWAVWIWIRCVTRQWSCFWLDFVLQSVYSELESVCSDTESCLNSFLRKRVTPLDSRCDTSFNIRCCDQNWNHPKSYNGNQIVDPQPMV